MKLFFTSFPLPSYLSLFIICLMLVPETVQSSECGLKKSPVRGQNRIANGQEAEVNEWPWMAYLGLAGRYCGGAVIGEEWIITAAHCLLGFVGGNDKKYIKIYLGEHDTNTDSETNKTKVYYVKYFKLHEKFNVDPIRNDIAVIKVTRSIDLDLHTPVCLPGENEDFEGSTVTALGWGPVAFLSDVGYGRYVHTNQLQEAQLTIRDPSVCSKKFGSDFTTPSNLCFGGLGTSTCSGDRGGPVTVEDRESRHTLVGIVSFDEFQCGKGSLSTFASVSYYRAWIKQKTGI